jgi:nucleoside-diphosphate-sugar epimerase
MITGKGLIAKTFISYQDNDSVVIFASGVSNSTETNPIAFQREIDQLNNILLTTEGKLLVYFSTTSINNASRNKAPYIIHKINMEARVLNLPNFIILRLPQIVGKSSNPFTLTNFLYRKIKLGEEFELWGKVKRDLLDADDLFAIAKKIIDSKLHQNSIINIGTANKYTMENIVSIFEKVLSKKAVYLKKDFGETFEYDLSYCFRISRELNLSFDDGYLERILRKYYLK